jgi:hypothetical protein
MVGFLIRELSRPQVAERVDQVMAIERIEPVKADPRTQVESVDPARFQELLNLAGWDAERFAKLQQGQRLSDATRTELIELIWRLRTFDAPQLAIWAQGLPTKTDGLQTSDAGVLGSLKGRVTNVTRHELPADLASRFEMPAYYECEMTGTDVGPATILTARVPQAWLKMNSLDEPAAASAVLVDVRSDNKDSPHGIFVSREIAWHPVEPNLPFVSVGKSILGGLGLDVGLFDGVRQRTSIAASEAELFYKLLGVVGGIGTNQLDRIARQQLPFIAQRWANQAQMQKSSGDPARVQLAREVEDRAAKARYSVAPLFNDAANQVGELVALEGIVRRVTPISFRNFHYFEIDLFTDDSQNNPIVFVVRELPPGMPIGDGLHVPVRIAGFFFKSWSFQSRRATLPTADDSAAAPGEMRQFAPLVIGRSPIMLEQAQTPGSESFGWIAAAICLVLLGVIWVAGWWLAREDRRFVQTTLAKQFSVADGESLNDLQFDLSEGGREHE